MSFLHNEHWRDFTIPVEGLDVQTLLTEWRWLIPENMKPLLLSFFGDWMLESPDGKIHFLDLLEGDVNCISQSAQELESMLQQEENRKHWLMTDWVQICRERGLHLAVGECYGWKIAPHLGGKLDFQNIQVFDLAVYECITGQVHRQTPEGYVVTGFRIVPQKHL
jgi:hypothetical protein